MHAAGTTYFLACRRWFCRDEDDGLIERDLYPGTEEECGKQDMQYTAEVFTSDMRGAGTDADVSLVLFGDQGDSGTQPLNVSCCAVLCCAVLRFAMLCFSPLCYALLSSS